MKLHIRIKTVAAMTLALSLFLSACGTAASGVSAAQTEAIQEATETTAVVTEDGADVYSSDSTLVTTMESIDRDAQFTDRDLEETYEAKGAVTIDIGAEATDGTVTITEEGVYLLHGTLDGQIVVAAADTAKVQLVLDGVTMTNADGPCIFVQSADKVFLTLAEGSENSLADTGEAYVQPDAGSTVDGVVFSRDDLVLNGTGTLKVTANYANGIVSKDDLKITGGVILVSAAAKGVEANDSIRIAGGTIDIVSGDDGIHSDNAEDAGKGYIYICGGEITVKAGDDGIHAATALLITEGIIDVTESYEGLEGDTVDMYIGVYRT